MTKMPPPPNIQLPIQSFEEVEEIINTLIRYLDELRQEVEKAT